MASLIPLTSDDVHLWFASQEEISDERLLARYRDLLSCGEREQQERFRFEKDRRRYLVSRALVRTVLTSYVDLGPAEWRFCVNRYGRPEIANAEARESRLSFNIAHTDGLIVMAVGRGRTVGVDVEYVDARKASVEVATRYFAPREVAALEAAPRELQDHLFFEYWTLKEAYIKARGMGLSLPLDKFSFHDSDGHVEIAIDPALEDDPMRWYFWQLRSTPQHLIALCVERISADAPRLGIRHCVPLLKVQECSLVALRASRNESSRTSAPRSAVSLMSNDYG